jgi:hypothetical protein
MTKIIKSLKQILIKSVKKILIYISLKIKNENILLPVLS